MSKADLRPYKGISPKIAKSAYVDQASCLIGDVTIGEESSIWPMVVARGDVNYIKIGDRTNIQDGSVLHVTHKNAENGFLGKPLIIGNDVTVGHKVCLHGCILEDACFIGMGATIMDGTVVQSGAMVAAGALVAENKVIESGWLYAGVPAKKFRELNDKEKTWLLKSAKNYVGFSKEFAQDQNLEK